MFRFIFFVSRNKDRCLWVSVLCLPKNLVNCGFYMVFLYSKASHRFHSFWEGYKYLLAPYPPKINCPLEKIPLHNLIYLQKFGKIPIWIAWSLMPDLFFRLLDKLSVVCPHSDSCKETAPRGNLEDHLKYR